jgi:tRNA (guanine-N7-)-methyltransferase
MVVPALTLVRRSEGMGRAIKIEAPQLRLDPEAIEQAVDWKAVFGATGPIEVEIGIGKGRFLLEAATLRPEVLHLGIEWANKYLRIAERRASRRGLDNVRFARLDGRLLICRAIPDASVTAYYVFYPDPWPKKRHHKRRFFQRETLDHLARTLVPGGYVHAATDHDEYWSVIEPLMDGDERFERLPQFGGPNFPLPVDGPLTNYEEKYGREGRSRNRGSWRLRAASDAS